MKIDLKTGKMTGKFTHPLLGRVTFTSNGVVRPIKERQPRTTTSPSQFMRQIKMRNASALWPVLKDLRMDDDLFPRGSAWNKFVGMSCSTPVNFGLPQVYHANHYCTLAPVPVSFGSYPSVSYDFVNEVTDLYLDGKEPIDLTTISYRDFVRHLAFETSPDHLQDACLVLLVLHQVEEEGHPHVSGSRYNIFLDEDQDVLLCEKFPGIEKVLEFVLVDGKYCLTVNRSIRNCGFAFIICDIENESYDRSTQYLICRNSEENWQRNLPLLQKEFESVNPGRDLRFCDSGPFASGKFGIISENK